jgi:acetylornithine/succinyldiaminopimelate/putrescine aminotransferase
MTAVDPLRAACEPRVAPRPETAAALATLAAHEPAVLHAQLPVLWTAAQGGRVFGEGDQAWLDWTCGVFATNLGHAPPSVVAAMREQLRAPLLHAYAFATRVRADIVRLLCELTGYQYTVLTTTGTEAA